MKTILSNFITANAAQPFKKGTWVHLQEGIKEGLQAIARHSIGLNYTTGVPYILYGCKNSTVAPTYTMSAGAIFYDGEVYLVDAVTFTSPGSEICVGNIVETFYLDATADPVTFTDGSLKSVHSIKKIVLSSGLSSSGLFDFETATIPQILTPAVLPNVAADSGGDFTNTYGIYPGFYYRKNTVTNMVTIGGSVTAVGIPPDGVIANLPVGFRPIKNVTFAVRIVTSPAVNNQQGYGQVLTTGAVGIFAFPDVGQPSLSGYGVLCHETSFYLD